MMNLEYQCPKCGKPGRVDQQAGWRICSNRACRHRFEQSKVKPVEVMPETSVPNFPCPKCGKETKEHHDGKRICSNVKCRAITAASAFKK